MEKIIIIGSGPAGYTAAIYAARANMNPLLMDGGLPTGPGDLGAGGQLMITTEVENYPGFKEGITGPGLMDEMRAQSLRFGTRIVEDRVTRADLSRRPFQLWVNEDRYEAQVIIICTGANAKWLGIPSEAALMNRGVSACATCDGSLPIFRNQPLLVVGGGDTAMEEALYLTRHASKVTIVHRRDQLRASRIMQQRAMDHPKIEFAWNSVIQEIHDVSLGRVSGATLRDVKTGETRLVEASGVFLAIGHSPNSEIFKGQLEMDEVGYLVTHRDVRTSRYAVFAAGDVQDRVYRQAVTAAGTGCMAALEAIRLIESEGANIMEAGTEW